MNTVELNTEKQAAPFLRWAGSKKQLVPKLYSYWSSKRHNKYIEPFLGAAHLYFALDESNSVLGDINYDLINAYSTIKYQPLELHWRLAEMPVDKDFYYQLRSIDLTSLSCLERAARFIYLNRYCFNGLYRTDAKGRFNVPFAPKNSGRIPSLNEWLAVSKKLETTKLICGDFENTIHNCVSEGDFVYLDPPYFSNNKSFTEYSASGFKTKDFDRLVRSIEYIDSLGASFLLSYVYDEQFIEAFNDWFIQPVVTKRTISSSTATRIDVKEILVSNIDSLNVYLNNV